MYRVNIYTIWTKNPVGGECWNWLTFDELWSFEQIVEWCKKKYGQAFVKAEFAWQDEAGGE